VLAVDPSCPLTDFITAWDFSSPLAWLVIAVTASYTVGLVRLQRRSAGRSVSRARAVYAYTGLALLGLSLFGPLDAYAGRAFFIHMTQHLVLALITAPLLLAAGPMSALMWAMPEQLRLGLGGAFARQGALRAALSFVTKPQVALPAFIGTFYIWHLPSAYDAALRNGAVHFVEHATMFFSGVLFWWPLIGPAPLRSPLSYPQRTVYLLAAVTPKALLGAIITLSGRVLYRHYLSVPDVAGIPDEEDQVISGLLMWVPGNFIFLAALTVLFFKWYQSEEGSLDGSPRQSPKHNGGGGSG